jgi:putative FmdB family regulatory protein
MPIRDYQCGACGHAFEALVRSEEKVCCRICGSTELAQQLSVFAAPTRSAAAEPALMGSPCGSCGHPGGPGACQLQ